MSDAETKPAVNPHRHSDAAAFLAALFANPATTAEPLSAMVGRAVVAADLLCEVLGKPPWKGGSVRCRSD